MKVELAIVKNDICLAMIDEDYGLFDSQICAGGERKKVSNIYSLDNF